MHEKLHFKKQYVWIITQSQKEYNDNLSTECLSLRSLLSLFSGKAKKPGFSFFGVRVGGGGDMYTNITKQCCILMGREINFS